MKNNLTTALSVILLSGAMTAPCFASTIQGAYLNGNLGATQFPDLTFKDSNTSLSLSSKIGLAGGIAFGSQNENLRVELAANYWENRIKRAALYPNLPPNLYTNTGTGSITLGMINGYYDFNPHAPFTPYLGLGVGAAHFRSDFLFDATDKAHASHTDIAYQGIVGANWDVAPCVKANLDYRYLLTGPQRINVNQPLSSHNLRSNYQNHRVSVGLTYYIN